MRTILATLALALFTVADGQDQTTPPKGQQTDPVTNVQDPAPEPSMYNDCLTDAGPYTWKVLGLNNDQMSRMTALQNRYKQDMLPPKADAKADKAAKDAKAKTGSTATPQQPQPKSTDQPRTNGTEQMDKNMKDVDDNLADDKGKVNEDERNALDELEATAQEGQTPLTVDQELQTILTPEQFALWDKQCGQRTSLQP